MVAANCLIGFVTYMYLTVLAPNYLVPFLGTAGAAAVVCVGLFLLFNILVCHGARTPDQQAGAHYEQACCSRARALPWTVQLLGVRTHAARLARPPPAARGALPVRGAGGHPAL